MGNHQLYTGALISYTGEFISYLGEFISFNEAFIRYTESFTRYCKKNPSPGTQEHSLGTQDDSLGRYTESDTVRIAECKHKVGIGTSCCFAVLDSYLLGPCAVCWQYEDELGPL